MVTITKRQYQAILFSRQYTGWHTYGRTASREVKQLAARGLVQVNRYGQFRATEPDGSIRDR